MTATSSVGRAFCLLSLLFRSFSPTFVLFQVRLCGGFCRGGWSGACVVVSWGPEGVLHGAGGFEGAAAATVRAARRCLFGAGRKERGLHGTERCNEA